jgi:hypothetical protein
MKSQTMKKVFYLLSFLFSLVWVIGFFLLGAGMFIHCILVIAVLLYLQGLISAPRLRSRIGAQTYE